MSFEVVFREERASLIPVCHWPPCGHMLCKKTIGTNFLTAKLWAIQKFWKSAFESHFIAVEKDVIKLFEISLWI